MYNISKISDHQAFTNYLSEFVTPQRKAIIERVLSERTDYITLGLENVYHTQNASALIRTAECMGVQDIHIIEDTVKYKLNKGISKGAQQWMNTSYYNELGTNDQHLNAVDCVQQLKSKGYAIVATLPVHDAIPMHQIPVDKPLAFFFGTEKEGLSDAIINAVDHKMTIPMVGTTESLNVSVAAGIILNYFSHKIKDSQQDWQLSTERQKTIRLKWFLDAVSNADTHIRHFANVQ